MTVTLVPTTLKPGARCCAEGGQQQLSPEMAQQFTDDLLILAHPIRIEILTMLARSDGQVCVCDVEAALPVKMEHLMTIDYQPYCAPLHSAWRASPANLIRRRHGR